MLRKWVEVILWLLAIFNCINRSARHHVGTAAAAIAVAINAEQSDPLLTVFVVVSFFLVASEGGCGWVANEVMIWHGAIG